MQNSEWFNYHHLYYFWRVAREGSLSRAADQLRLSHSTLSTQIRALEESLGGELFLRSGRALSLTALGRDVLHYADEIFRVGTELLEMVQSKSSSHVATLGVGVVSTVPRTVAYRLMEPVLALEGHGPLRMKQGSLEHLLDEMATGHIHLILTDEPPPQGLALHVYSHTLAETAMQVYGSPSMAEKYRPGFPQSLSGAPMFLPIAGSSLRQRLESWFSEHKIRVSLRGEFDSSELLRVFGAMGHGLFPAQAALGAEIEESFGAARVGELEGVRERYYAIAPERKVRRADVQVLLEQVRERLLEPLPRRRP